MGVQGMEGHSERTFELTAQRWTRMKANAADVPFAFEKGESGTATVWRFHLQHSTLADFMPLAQQMLVASRLPDAEQEEFLAVSCGWLALAGWLAGYCSLVGWLVGWQAG